MRMIRMNEVMAKRFIVEHARPLERAIYDYFFEGGAKEAVIGELGKFQNQDGGFGKGLEPDNWNPASNPIATNDAIMTLHRIQAFKEADGVISGIVRYLRSHDSFDEEKRRWLFAIETNKDHPHAVWWEKKGDGLDGYNPTVSLAAFMVCFGEDISYYEEIIREAYVYLRENAEMGGDMVKCYMLCYELLKENGITDLISLADMNRLIRERMASAICRDVEKYGVEYVTVPSDFFADTHPEFESEDIQKLIAYEKRILSKTQKEDGGFDITWQWYTPYAEFEQARQWWRPRITIDKMLYDRNVMKS